MAQRKRSRATRTTEETAAKAISTALRQFGTKTPEESASELIRKNPLILQRVAKYLVQQCFRNTVIEDYHAGLGLSGSKSRASRITQAEMKALMIEAVDKTYAFLWALLREDIGKGFLADFGVVDPVAYWNEPELDPKFAMGLIAMMRAFAAGAASSGQPTSSSKARDAEKTLTVACATLAVRRR